MRNAETSKLSNVVVSRKKRKLKWLLKKHVKVVLTNQIQNHHGRKIVVVMMKKKVSMKK